MTNEHRPLSSETAPKATVWPVFVLYGAVLLWLVVVGMVGIIAIVVLTAGPDVLANPKELTKHVESVARGPAVLLGGLAVSAPTLVVVPFVFLRTKGVSWTQRLRWTPATPVSIMLATLAGLCLSQAGNILLSATGRVAESSLGNMSAVLRSPSTGVGVFWVFVLLFLLSAVGEELFFRGVIQGRLAHRWGRWPAIIVAAALFGLLHLDVLHSTFAFFFGLFLGWSVERSQSIVPAVVVHVINNLVYVLSVRRFPYFDASWTTFVGCVVVGAVTIGVLTRKWPIAETSGAVDPAPPIPPPIRNP